MCVQTGQQSANGRPSAGSPRHQAVPLDLVSCDAIPICLGAVYSAVRQGVRRSTTYITRQGAGMFVEYLSPLGCGRLHGSCKWIMRMCMWQLSCSRSRSRVSRVRVSVATMVATAQKRRTGPPLSRVTQKTKREKVEHSYTQKECPPLLYGDSRPGPAASEMLGPLGRW